MTAADEDYVDDIVLQDVDSDNYPPDIMTHKAVLQNGFGSNKYSIKRVPTPRIERFEIQISVKACGVSFQDLMVRQGAIEGIPKQPFTPGFQCSGDIVSIGEEVSGFEVGERVMVLTHYQAWANIVTVPAAYVFKMPDKMSYEEGAAFALNYTMAYLLVIVLGNVRPGAKIFVHSLGGSIGTAISELCKNVIQEVIVLGTASPFKKERIKDLSTIIYNHDVDYVFDTKQMYPEGVDVVFDSRYGEDFNKGFGLLAPLGKYILYGTSCLIGHESRGLLSFSKSWWHVDKLAPTRFLEDNLSLAGVNFRRLFFAFPVEQGDRSIVMLRTMMNRLTQWYEEGKLRPIIDSVWAFDELPQAMHRLHSRKNIGTVVLDPTREKLIVETSQLHQPKSSTKIDPTNIVEGTVIGNVVVDND